MGLEDNYDDREDQNVKIEQKSTSAESRSCQEIDVEISSEASASDNEFSSGKQTANTHRKESGNEYIIPVTIEVGDEVFKIDLNKKTELKTEEKRYKQDNE